jgi:hypothetical protein
VVERVVDRRQALLVRDGLQVLEHDHETLVEGGEPVRELVDRSLDRAAGPVQALQGSAPEPVANAVDGRGDVQPEPRRVVVAGVERDPGVRSVAARTPGAHRRRLAVAGGRRDERQPYVVAAVERLQEPWPLDEARRRPGRRELGLGKRRSVGLR